MYATLLTFSLSLNVAGLWSVVLLVTFKAKPYSLHHVYDLQELIFSVMFFAVYSVAMYGINL